MDKILKHLNKIIIFLSLAIIIYLLLDLFILNGRPLFKKNASQNALENSETVTAPVTADIFYWGEGCPHCQDVKDWMAEQKVSEKMEVISKEIYNNQANSQELTARAKSCGLDTQRIGVPFLYTIDGDCIIGTPKIIEYLSEKIAQ